MGKIILSHERKPQSVFVVPVFKCGTLPHFLCIMKNYRLISNQLPARSEEQILHTRRYLRDNKTQMTFQEEF